jgi:hypothetical protein
VKRLISVVSLTAVALVAAACSGSDRSSSPASSSASTTTTLPVVLGPVRKTGEQPVSAVYGQGVARVPGGWIFSGTDSLWHTDDHLKEIKSLNPAIPPAWAARGFDHIGDIDVVGRYIYAPLEQPDYAKGYQATARYDRDTFRFVDAVLVPQHENSFVSVDPTTMTAYTMDRFDGKAVLRYDVAHHWKRLPPLPLTLALHHTQGADLLNGVLWISTSDPRNHLYGVDLASGRVRPNGSMGHVPGEGEGLDATALPSGDDVHTLVIDPKINPVWFEHFRVGAGAARG